MKYRWFKTLFPILILILACNCITTQNQITDNTDEVKSAPSILITEPQADPDEILKSSETLFVNGEEFLEKGEYNQARKLFLQAIAPLNNLDANTESQAATREELITNLSVSLVITGRLRDGFPLDSIPEIGVNFVYNEKVEWWVTEWLTRARKSIEKYLSRSGMYEDMIRKIILEEGLPQELAYLPVIESGYSPMAYSRAHAVGVWQFIRSTGKNYNLKIDNVVDERRDVEKATRAACRYLKKLHNQFGSWDLALAAYNCGEYRVQRQIAQQGTNDFWQLELPFETKSYVPKFYSVLLIASNPDFYGIRYQPEPPVEHVVVPLKLPVDLKALAQKTGQDYKLLKSSNPELLYQYTPPKAEMYPLKIPAEQHSEFQAAFNALADNDKYLSRKKAEQLISSKRVIIHVVKSGDSLWRIAKKYRTTVTKIRKWNRLGKRSVIRPGQRLKIYKSA